MPQRYQWHLEGEFMTAFIGPEELGGYWLERFARPQSLVLIERKEGGSALTTSGVERFASRALPSGHVSVFVPAAAIAVRSRCQAGPNACRHLATPLRVAQLDARGQFAPV